MNHQWINQLPMMAGYDVGVASALWRISIFILAGWIAHLFLRSFNPKWRVFLWRFVIIGCLALSASSMIKTLPKMKVPLTLPARERSITPVAHSLRQQPTMSDATSEANTKVTPPLSSIAPLPLESSKAPLKYPVTFTLIALWGLGLGISFIRGLWGLAHMRRLVLGATQPSTVLATESSRLQALLKLRAAPSVRESSIIRSPVLVWWRHSFVLLPAMKENDANQITAVLAHEFAHIKNHDLFWNTGLDILKSVLWFLPWVWCIRKTHMNACELVADATAASLMQNTSAYQRVVAEMALQAEGISMGLAFAWKSDVRQRLERLPKTLRQKPIRLSYVIPVLLLSLTVSVLIGGSAVVPMQTISGKVLLPDGSPASDAVVYLATHQQNVSIRDGDVESPGKDRRITDASGDFKFQHPDERFKLFAYHDSGTVTLTRKEWEAGQSLMIQPWGRIEGRMMIGGQPAANEMVHIMSLPIIEYSGIPSIDIDLVRETPVVTDDEGRFSFDRIAPGTYLCSRIDPQTKGFTMPADAIRILPGQKVVVTLQMNGKTVVGKIDRSAMGDQALRKQQFFIREVLLPKDNFYPDHLLSPEEQAEAMDKYWQSDAGLIHMRKNLNRISGTVDEQGNFHAEHVKPGNYQLSLWAYPTQESGMERYKQLGGAQRVFEVPESSDEVDVGTIHMVPNRAERLTVGDPMPNLTFKIDGGIPTQLKDYMGRPMLVSFGGTFYYPAYFSKEISDYPQLHVVQIRTTQAGNPLPDVKAPKDPRFISGYVENGGIEAGYLLGMGGTGYSEAYLLNDKGIVLEKAENIKDLLPALAGAEKIDGEKNPSPGNRFFVNTEFCIVSDEDETAGNRMKMAEEKGINIITVSNSIVNKKYRMQVRYLRSQAGKDLYQIEMVYPDGSNTVEVAYAGEDIELYRDDLRTFHIRPSRP
ncbi:M56 family metallopeptidase [Kiritimatiellota bacterium B12222]|nr:M56 family metallopeptidase [Kiritimatiellota bacterium B12222]